MPRPRPDSRGTIGTSDQELGATVDDLSPGRSIYIRAANVPYRTTQWLDIDVDGVTVVGPGIRTLVKPADDTNVGGIRIGHNIVHAGASSAQSRSRSPPTGLGIISHVTCAGRSTPR